MSREVREMFSSIAARYDLTNDILCLGIHRLWKKKAIRALSPVSDGKYLDVCCGTGDLSFAIAKKLGNLGKVVGIDFAQEMLEVARKRKGKLPSGNGVGSLEFICGDAMELPFSDKSFSGSIVSFGIRNVDNLFIGLKELKRVTKPGGRVVILEFGKPQVKIVSFFFQLYSRYLMPHIGKLFTGNKEAYQYLPQTSMAFVCGNDFIEIMKEAGFTNASYQALFGGIAYLYCDNP